MTAELRTIPVENFMGGALMKSRKIPTVATLKAATLTGGGFKSQSIYWGTQTLKDRFFVVAQGHNDESELVFLNEHGDFCADPRGKGVKIFPRQAARELAVISSVVYHISCSTLEASELFRKENNLALENELTEDVFDGRAFHSIYEIEGVGGYNVIDTSEDEEDDSSYIPEVGMMMPQHWSISYVQAWLSALIGNIQDAAEFDQGVQIMYDRAPESVKTELQSWLAMSGVVVEV